MARYDVGQVKALAIGRWPALLGLDLEILDKRHHPCPKCGGRDRFRALDDFERSGAVICNQCFNGKNGDGIASYAWLNDCSNGQAIVAVAEQVGALPIGQDGSGKGKGKSTRKGAAANHPKRPAEDRFKWQAWNESLAAIFCMRKRGIVPTSLVECGARLGRHSGITVIALPIRNQSGQVVGYTAANSTGSKIVIRHPDGEEETTSWKNLIDGGQKGIIGTANLWDEAAQQSITRIYKTEGPSDLLAIVGLLQPGEAAFCNPCGANENPSNFAWVLEWLKEKQVIIIHDRDKAGVDGALGDQSRGKIGWAAWAAQSASEVRNVELPFPLVDSHGQDFRQWVIDGGDAAGLTHLVESAAVIQPPDASEMINEADADPHRLARVNLKQYQTQHGRRLIFWRDEWWRWKGGKYAKLDVSELRSKVTQAIRTEYESIYKQAAADYQAWKDGPDYDQDRDKGPPKINTVTRPLVSNVIGAMEGMVILPGSIEMPSWIPDRSKRHYVSMENGILDLDKVCDGKPMEEFLLPHSPNWFSAFQLKYAYSKSASCPKWLDYLDFSMEGDRDRIAILQEWAGYMLTATNDFQKFMAFEGHGQNGKTVYFAAIRAMLGEENVSSVALENFAGRFDLESTLGKACNISADVGELDYVAEGILKQFTGGDTMQFDRKNRQPISARPSAKLMLSWNKRPRFRDRSKGLWRRMILVPFNRPVTEERRIFGMDNPQWWIDCGEAPGILRWAIVGLDRLKTNLRFTHSTVCQKMLDQYQQDTNPACEFLFDHCEEGNIEDVIECRWLYRLYHIWSLANGNKPLANNSFGKEVMKKFPDAIRDRKDYSADRARPWIYRGIKFSVDEICERSVFEIFT